MRPAEKALIKEIEKEASIIAETLLNLDDHEKRGKITKGNLMTIFISQRKRLLNAVETYKSNVPEEE